MSLPQQDPAGPQHLTGPHPEGARHHPGPRPPDDAPHGCEPRPPDDGHQGPGPQADPATRRYRGTDEGPELELPHGDVTERVVRVGDTVRRPHQPTSLAVAAYLDHLQRAGFDGAPRYLGRDAAGRDVLTFLHGQVPGSPPQRWAADDGLLAEVGRLLHRLHDASAGFGADTGFAAPPGSSWLRDTIRVDVPVPAWEPELISHNDVTPQNVVFRDGRAVGLIDFDLVGPTTRLREVTHTAMHWVPFAAPADLPPDWSGLDQAHRLRVFADGYGLADDDRARVVDEALAAAGAGWLGMRAAAEQLGGGWARMWADGVGDRIRRREAWLRAERDRLTAALLADRP